MTAGHLTALRPEDVVTLYTAQDAEYYKTYQNALMKKMTCQDTATKKYLRPWKFEIVPGFFKQSEPETDAFKFDYIEEDFGLNKPSWTKLVEELQQLNLESKDNVSYKLLFLARHGQGWHNYAIVKYGQEAWDDKWSRMNGDGELVWGPDPFLTPLGIEQAEGNNSAWKQQLAKGAPIPSAFYSSPFTRSIETLIHTWDGVVDYTAMIKEDVRETIGEHTCDKRSPKRVIQERFGNKGFVFEDGFEEEDIYYQDDYRETLCEQTLRINNFLNFLFEKDWQADKKDVFVNVTSHSGTIRSFIMATGHRDFAIGTGGMIPVVIKATRRTDDL
ncbi:putative phosphomutase [Saccharomycopsis crataegensis]|uniref:Phosphomutase n=1 Tax=Saccharomycopsis crataegensis TaxID=43959 RepID=A0AAV5QD73_9ASCO|nr:putative phosphomutase [Saccharomycopsis crataegensis]